ncbi:MAG: hypothetical protein KF901_27790, partial [Myxococcales bacterium]|nr:hypothetical protein [Myxococcales bacterium]
SGLGGVVSWTWRVSVTPRGSIRTRYELEVGEGACWYSDSGGYNASRKAGNTLMKYRNVRSMSGDRWVNAKDEGWSADWPADVEFENALLRLDAVQYTMIILESSGEKYMAIGGGDGRYVVYVASESERFWSLIGLRSEPGVCMLNVGGQEGDYPLREVVSLAQARDAGLEFIRTGEMDPAQTWEER